MQKEYDAIIVGGGACGLMCAVQAGFLGKKVLILEKNSKVGAKILISGGGRCNYTNIYASSKEFTSQNPHFIKSALSQFSAEDTVAFFEAYGIQGQEKKLGQLFPTTNNAKDIVRVFTQLCEDLEQDIWCNTTVTAIHSTEHGFEVTYSKQDMPPQFLHAPKVVMASGGLPIPKMGATDFSLQVALQFGLNVCSTAPALVPLTIGHNNRDWYAELSGISIFCRVQCGAQIFEENLLFTHWGLSGPAILQISSYWRLGQELCIDFLPHYELYEELHTARQVQGKKLLKTYLTELLPEKFVLQWSTFPLEKRIADLSKHEIQTLVTGLKDFKVQPAGDKGYEKAEVMRGGIDTNELKSNTLESKKIPGLYFGGECVDVTGWLGGYNFQWAWASGYVIAQDL